MTNHAIRRAAGLLAALLLPLLAYAATGDLMSVTSTMKMQVPGAPAAVADMLNRTTTIQQCVARGDLTEPKTWSTKGDCTASAVHRTASGMTAHLVCQQMTGDLEVHLLPDGGVHGTMKMSGTSNGMQMSGVQTFDAKRVGACDAGKPAG